MDTEKKYEILVVDDEETFRKSLGRVLRKNYNIKYAASGNEAIQMLKSGYEPDVCTCDVAMNDGNGKDVYEAMSDDFKRRIIFMTGGGFRKDLNQFIVERRGDDRVIDKPFNVEELKWLVAEILAERKKQLRNQK